MAGSTDVLEPPYVTGTGPTAGAGNIAADTAPAVQVYQRYPALVTLTVDDAGMTAGTDTYYANTVLPVADAAGVPVGAAITVGYPLAQTLVSEFQGWMNAGRDVTTHSMSHTYYTNTDALEIQYTGSGTAATLSISNKTLTITVTGASDGVTYNLAQGQTQGTIKGLRLALLATGKFTATEIPTCQGPYGTGCSAYTEAALLAQDLADVSGQDVKTSVYHMQLDVTRLTTDEITLSRQWMTTNLTGLPATPVYVYPGGYETTTMQGITAGVPYIGARGALKEDLGVKDTYADGFNVQNITSFGVNPSWMGLEPAVLNQKIQALVWKESVWGVPWGIFWHLNELTNNDPVGGTEITNLIQDFKSERSDDLHEYGAGELAAQRDAGERDRWQCLLQIRRDEHGAGFPSHEDSPVVDAGQNLGAAYELDINGVNQNSYGSGWEIGAQVYQGYATYGEGTGTGRFTIGTTANQPLAGATLPQVWVNSYEGDTLFSYELSLPSTWVTSAAPGCTFHTPYWTGSPSSSGLQSAIADIEACRTATGAGIALDIPPALYTSASGITIPQTNSAAATAFLVLRSTQDANLPNGQTVCSHGIQDNLATSTDIGLINADCAGDALAYQLGKTVTSIPTGAFTLANGQPQNTANYDDAQYMWTVEASGTNLIPLTFCNASATATAPTCASNIGPDHWLIEDMEARMSAGNTGANNVIQVGFENVLTASTQFPAHVHFRKIWAHGDYATLNGSNKVSAGIQMPCAYCSMVDSQFSEMLRPGAEGHVILSQGPGPYKINHNWMEGQSSSIFSGGFSATPLIAGFVPFQDVEIRRNRFTFPYAWLGVMTIPSGDVWAGQSLVRKNCQEWKEGERILRDGNICENVDNSGGQNGGLTDINIRQVSGTGATGTNYQATINDVTYTNEIDRNACEGIIVAGRSASSPGNGGGVSYPIKRMLIGNVLEYNISKPTNPGCGGNTFGMQVASPGQTWKGTITENSAGTQATFTITCSVDGGDCPAGPPSVGFQQTDATARRPGICNGMHSRNRFQYAYPHGGRGDRSCRRGAFSGEWHQPAGPIGNLPLDGHGQCQRHKRQLRAGERGRQPPEFTDSSPHPNH